jgi:hypothetical protein
MSKDDNYEQLSGSAKVWTDEQVVLIDRGLRTFYALMGLAFIAPILSFLVRPDSESFDIWFQRSGAIIVVLSLFAEIKVNELSRLAIKQDHTFLFCHIFLKSKYEKKLSIFNYLTLIFTSIGTVVWGYGDVVLTGC